MIVHVSIEATDLTSPHNLKEYYAKTINIRLRRKESLHCIFWRHITTIKYCQRYFGSIKLINVQEKYMMNTIIFLSTYYVPTSLLVFASSWFPLKILAMPKSDILGVISLSNNMLLALRSLCIILNLESSWR